MTGTSSRRRRSARRDALPRVHEEDDQVRLGHAVGDLVLDVLGELIDVLDAYAAGIDQLDVALADGARRGDPVPRDAGRRVHDRDPVPDQAVEQAALADVRPAHDGDGRKAHHRHRSDWGRRRQLPPPLVAAVAAAGRAAAPA
jgi:hypothetical protein